MSGEAIAVVAAAVGMLGILVPLMLYLHGRVAGELAEVRRDLGGLGERVAHLEGAVQSLDARAARMETAIIDGRAAGGSGLLLSGLLHGGEHLLNLYGGAVHGIAGSLYGVDGRFGPQSLGDFGQ